ncbi:MAG: hypothetical protein C0506_11130 [Anaerolinea sp.]|nr:hypothetical protein [Anaerolinea sp.]
MEVQGEYRFNAPRETVYRMLLDPAMVEVAMPGCERFEPDGPDRYDITMRVGIAALRGVYRGKVRVAGQAAPASYSLEMTGSGTSGGITGRAQLVLSDEGSATLLRYKGDLKAQGALASLGIQMLSGSAKIVIGQFMKAMDKEIRDRTA